MISLRFNASDGLKWLEKIESIYIFADFM